MGYDRLHNTDTFPHYCKSGTPPINVSDFLARECSRSFERDILGFTTESPTVPNSSFRRFANHTRKWFVPAIRIEKLFGD